MFDHLNVFEIIILVVVGLIVARIAIGIAIQLIAMVISLIIFLAMGIFWVFAAILTFFSEVFMSMRRCNQTKDRKIVQQYRDKRNRL